MEKLVEMDGSILLWIQEHLRNGILTPVMKCITRLGNGGLIWLALIVLLLLFHSTRRTGITALLAMLLTLLVINLLLKNMIARIRPYETVVGLTRIISAPTDFSFPSGHAGHAFAASVVFFRELPKKLGIPALVFAFLISFSRLYVGVHYPTDVLAGAILGTAMALLATLIVSLICKIKKFGWAAVGESDAENIDRRNEL